MLGSVGAKGSIGHSFICDYGRNIHIGNNVTVNTGCTFVDCNRITIGNNVLIAPNVQIYTATHPIDLNERLTPVETDEGMADGSLGADAAQHLLQHMPFFLLMVVRQGIVFHQEPVRLVLEFQKHLVMAVIPFARHAFFQFSHYFLLS